MMPGKSWRTVTRIRILQLMQKAVIFLFGYRKIFTGDVKFAGNKCILTGDPAHLEKLEKKATKDFEGRLSVYRSEGFYLEMMPLGVDKAYGVAKLLERLGYRRSQMVCCGDGFKICRD